jgi:hypothetical protein
MSVAGLQQNYLQKKRLQEGDEEVLEADMVTVAQSYECTYCYRGVCWKIIKILSSVY